MKPEWVPIWLACKCGHQWDDWQPVMAPIATWLAHAKTYRCPDCGKRGRNIFLRSNPITAVLGVGNNPGDVLSAVVQWMPPGTWTVADAKKGVEAHGVSVNAKAVYNAIGYLARRKRIQRLGYGKYQVLDNDRFQEPEEDR